jgi:hypothetical protein
VGVWFFTKLLKVDESTSVEFFHKSPMSPTLQTRCGLLLMECYILMDRLRDDLLRKMPDEVDSELFVELQEDIGDVLDEIDELELLANTKNQPRVIHGTN